jgi:[phosphatase 2A protein]-leucine-carboxy methyltransferase
LLNGFSAARALTLKDIRRSYIQPEELQRYGGYFSDQHIILISSTRISSLEFLDETEELDLVLSHYAMSWGLFLSEPEVQQDWGHWGLKQKSE